MKTENIKFITIASTDNRKVSKEFEEMENKKLLEIYKQFQEKPFDYATIDYYQGKEAEVKVYRQPTKQVSVFNLIKNTFKKIFKKIR